MEFEKEIKDLLVAVKPQYKSIRVESLEELASQLNLIGATKVIHIEKNTIEVCKVVFDVLVEVTDMEKIASVALEIENL